MNYTFRSITESMVDEVLSGMTFWPSDSEIYSTTGCKRVAQKVDVVYEQSIEMDDL